MYTRNERGHLEDLWNGKFRTKQDVSRSQFSLVNIRIFEVAQSCPTLCDSMDCSQSGFSIHGVFQARILEWVAISFSNRVYKTQILTARAHRL